MLSSQKCSFFLRLAHACPSSVALARLYSSSSRAKVVDATSGEGESNDKVCETADASVSFTTDTRKNISVSPCQEMRKENR